ncbi:hypothetical protein [Microbacterium sp. E-13]|uniref:hypothetical protein n=1 Tax=Microbacterium sp. E-13 TaxID=3404048 RepID=UPI003CF1D91F
MNLAALLLILLLSAAVLIGRPERAITRSLIGTILITTAVPLYAAPPWLIGVAMIACVCWMGMAMLLDPDGTGAAPASIGVVLLIGCDVVSRVRGAGPELALYNVALGAVLLMASVAASSVSARWGTTPILKAFALMLPVHLAISIAEQTGAVSTVWPRATWIDEIANRPQTILTFLEGRSMSTLGHPILLAVAAGIGVISAILLAHRTRKRSYYLLAAIGLAALALSGTRSILASLAIVGLYALVRKANFLIRALILGLAFVMWIYADGLDILQGATSKEVLESTSFTHRASVLEGVGPYLAQSSPGSILWGTGANGYVRLFTSGVFGGGDGLVFFDNQLVRTFVVGGILGTIALVAAVLISFLAGSTESRALILFMLPLFFSFDVLTWQSSFLYLVVALSIVPSVRAARSDALGVRGRTAGAATTRREFRAV